MADGLKIRGKHENHAYLLVLFLRYQLGLVNKPNILYRFEDTVETTYKGRLYKGTAAYIRVHIEEYDFFPISRVQIFALYKGT